MRTCSIKLLNTIGSVKTQNPAYNEIEIFFAPFLDNCAITHYLNRGNENKPTK